MSKCGFTTPDTGSNIHPGEGAVFLNPILCFHVSPCFATSKKHPKSAILNQKSMFWGAHVGNPQTLSSCFKVFQKIVVDPIEHSRRDVSSFDLSGDLLDTNLYMT